MCKKARAIPRTIQMQSQFSIVHWITLAFLRSFPNISKQQWIFFFKNIGCESKHVCFFKLPSLTSRPPLGYFDSQTEMFVCVWKRGFMVKTIQHYNFGQWLVNTIDCYRLGYQHICDPNELCHSKTRACANAWYFSQQSFTRSLMGLTPQSNLPMRRRCAHVNDDSKNPRLPVRNCSVSHVENLELFTWWFKCLQLRMHAPKNMWCPSSLHDKTALTLNNCNVANMQKSTSGKVWGQSPPCAKIYARQADKSRKTNALVSLSTSCSWNDL